MNILLALMKLTQLASTLAPVIQELRGKDPAQYQRLGQVMNAIIDAMTRGVQGQAYLQNLGAQLEQMHAQGKTIMSADIDAAIAEIEDAADQIEAERRKLDPPPPAP